MQPIKLNLAQLDGYIGEFRKLARGLALIDESDSPTAKVVFFPPEIKAIQDKANVDIADVLANINGNREPELSEASAIIAEENAARAFLNGVMGKLKRSTQEKWLAEYIQLKAKYQELQEALHSVKSDSKKIKQNVVTLLMSLKDLVRSIELENKAYEVYHLGCNKQPANSHLDNPSANYPMVDNPQPQSSNRFVRYLKANWKFLLGCAVIGGALIAVGIFTFGIGSVAAGSVVATVLGGVTGSIVAPAAGAASRAAYQAVASNDVNVVEKNTHAARRNAFVSSPCDVAARLAAAVTENGAKLSPPSPNGARYLSDLAHGQAPLANGGTVFEFMRGLPRVQQPSVAPDAKASEQRSPKLGN